ncbi:hypothetical protein MC885_012763 [Smutsia gigantea]|nr:hypothetical protein MC885_012763 [Smutsia gigantea]
MVQKKGTRSSSNTFFKIKHNWQKPRGPENRASRRFKGQMLMPNISYRSSKTKYVLPSGFRKFLVHNVKELEGLLKFKKTVLSFLTMFPPRTAKPL